MQRAILGIATLLFSLTSAYAQQDNGPASILAKYTEYLNAGNSEQLHSLYAPNALDINPGGKLKNVTAEFAQAASKSHERGLRIEASVDDVQSIFGGQGALVTANYTASFGNPSIPPGKGIILMVLEKSGAEWKIWLYRRHV